MCMWYFSPYHAHKQAFPPFTYFLSFLLFPNTHTQIFFQNNQDGDFDASTVSNKTTGGKPSNGGKSTDDLSYRSSTLWPNTFTPK